MKMRLQEGFLAVSSFLLEEYKMALITVNNLTFGYDGSCDNIFEHASFQIDTE